MDRSHLLKALKVLFPDKSSYRIRQGDIPLILYTYECYRRGIKEVRLTTKNVLFKRYFRTGKRNVIQIGENRRFAWKKIVPLTYMAGYLKKKYRIRSSVDMFLLSLLIDIKPTLFLIASSRFQKNKRLSRLSAENIAKEWVSNYQDAELFLKKENLEKTIKILNLKKGSEWKELFVRIDKALQKLPDSEIIAGLSYYFLSKGENLGEKNRLLQFAEEDIFYFDTIYQLLQFGNIRSPIHIGRVYIPETFSREAISITDYVIRKAAKKKVEPTALLFYYVIPGNIPPDLKGFFGKLEDPFSKRRTMWQFIYIRNRINTYSIDSHSYLPTLVRSFLDRRVNEAIKLMLERLRRIDMKTFEMDNNKIDGHP